MPLDLECGPCLKGLVRQLADLSSPREDLRARIVLEGDRVVEQAAGRADLEPTTVSTRFLRLARRLSGTRDPFAKRKAREITLARAALTRIRVPPVEDLAGRMALAVAGNAIDFFRPWSEVQRELTELPVFAVDHFPRLTASLNRGPARVLYLADNAGEVVFDLPLISSLLVLGHQVSLVVKGAPSQNDATEADLPAVGPLPRGLLVVDNTTDAVGTQLAEGSRAFRERVLGADVLLAKGMANYESLRGERSLPPTFFCFIAKCAPNARLAGVTVGSRVVLQKK